MQNKTGRRGNLPVAYVRLCMSKPQGNSVASVSTYTYGALVSVRVPPLTLRSSRSYCSSRKAMIAFWM